MKDANDGYKFTKIQAFLLGVCFLYLLYLFAIYKPFDSVPKVITEFLRE